MKLFSLDAINNFLNSLPQFEEREIIVNGQVNKDYKAILDKSNNKVVAIVSKKYSLVQHKDVFSLAIAKLRETYSDNEILGYVSHHRTKAYMFITFKSATIQNDSEYKLGLMITNSVDSTLSIWTTLFLYRVVCSNGLIEKSSLLQLQSKHINSEEILNRFNKKLSIVLNDFDSYVENELAFLEKTKTITANSYEIVKKLDLSKKARYRILGKVKPNDTLFNIYQAITDYFSNKANVSIVRRVDTIRKAKEIINQYVKLSG